MRPVRHRIDPQLLGEGRPARVLRLLRELQVELDRIQQSYASAVGLHANDLRAGDLISQNWEHPLTMGELADLLGLSSGAVTGTVDRLAGAGYVERVPDPEDRRRVHLHVTPLAEEVGLRYYAEHLEPLRAVAQGFGDEQLKVVERFLAEAVGAIASDLDESLLWAALEEVDSKAR